MSYIYCLLYPVAHGAIHLVSCQIYRVLTTKVNETSAGFPKRTLFAVHFAHFSAANCYRNHKRRNEKSDDGIFRIDSTSSQEAVGGERQFQKCIRHTGRQRVHFNFVQWLLLRWRLAGSATVNARYQFLKKGVPRDWGRLRCVITLGRFTVLPSLLIEPFRRIELYSQLLQDYDRS